MKLLIAYDGSECAEAALDDLTHAGLPNKGEALVMTVAEVWLPPPPPSAEEILEMATVAKGPLGLERKYMAGSKAVVEAGAMAEKAATRFSSLFPAWKVKHEAVWGSPTWELFSRAEEFKADLIAVGSHGRSALGRLFLGSISQWLLNEARCSVRVARGKLDEPDFPVRLLLGLDGSRKANAALEQIAARNWPAKSEVRVVLVDQPLEITYVGGVAAPVRRSVAAFNKKEQQKSQRLVNAAAKKLKDAGLRTMAEVVSGDPKRVLVQIAEEWRADCIFLGATGVGNRLERFLLGSTAGAVAARAHCSVEIVRSRRRRGKSNGNGN
ncbi:MAG TPA: universal stress protein [Pyrinomonadaceae bacterium]|jgi:nucleotide-binding universal stress UspA family protein|nr:universal stress protein [Pyrinomonadaceae bacterium]